MYIKFRNRPADLERYRDCYRFAWWPTKVACGGYVWLEIYEIRNYHVREWWSPYRVHDKPCPSDYQ